MKKTLIDATTTEKNALTTQYINMRKKNADKKYKTILKCIRDYCMDCAQDDSDMPL